MATHASILGWEYSWTEEPGDLQSWGHKESDTTKPLNSNKVSWTLWESLSVCSEMVPGLMSS